MKYKVGAKIITKKPHACGAKDWLVERVGADIKIRCLNCGRVIFLLPDELDKMTKEYIEVNGEDNG